MAKKRSQGKARELEELESAYEELSGRSVEAKNSDGDDRLKQKRIVWIICISLVAVAILAGTFALIGYARNNQTIRSNLTIMGVDVTGLTRTQAQEALEKAFDELYSASPMTVEVDGQTALITPKDSAVQLDVKAAVNAAINYQNGSFTTQVLNITDFLSVDREGILSAIKVLEAQLNSTLVQSSYRIEGEAPESLAAIDETVSQSLIITKGQPGVQLDPEELMSVIMDGYSNGQSTVSSHSPITDPDAIDLEAVYQENCSSPVEAEFEEDTFAVLGGTYGYGFSVEKAVQALEQADYGQEVTLDFVWTAPEVTAEALKNTLFQDELASYSTHANSNSDRNTNLRLACEAIDGIILYPGDLFSYNETLGKRTPEKGYRPGTSYVGGETVLSYGGGICQVSSTLFYCTVVADLEVVERECHGYASSYTPLSTDATVFWGGIDYKFRNNTDYPIKIEASSDRGDVTVKLIGTDTKDYYVKFESEFIAQIDYETVYKEMEADNKKGYKDGDVITDPYTGYKSKGYRVKYDKQTGEMIERILECSDYYSARNKVICKIVGTETEPPATEPPATQPPTTQPPVTEPPTTEPPITEAPTEPSTEAPTPVPEESAENVEP